MKRVQEIQILNAVHACIAVNAFLVTCIPQCAWRSYVETTSIPEKLMALHINYAYIIHVNWYEM
jgi:hypothetical protein